jgi:hypothetical protein
LEVSLIEKTEVGMPAGEGVELVAGTTDMVAPARVCRVIDSRKRKKEKGG